MYSIQQFQVELLSLVDEQGRDPSCLVSYLAYLSGDRQDDRQDSGQKVAVLTTLVPTVGTRLCTHVGLLNKCRWITFDSIWSNKDKTHDGNNTKDVGNDSIPLYHTYLVRITGSSRSFFDTLRFLFRR
jgi:hypothetical protein